MNDAVTLLAERFPRVREVVPGVHMSEDDEAVDPEVSPSRLQRLRYFSFYSYTLLFPVVGIVRERM